MVSLVVFGIAVTRGAFVPRAVAIALVVSGPLFLIGATLDNFAEGIASGLMIVCFVWIALRAWQAARQQQEVDAQNLPGANGLRERSVEPAATAGRGNGRSDQSG